MNKEQIIQQKIAIKKLEERAKEYQDSLYKFLLYYREKEKKVKLDENRHIELICKELEDVYYGKTKRLMINVPPRSLKTEIVSRIFPARCLGKKQGIKFIGISYSAGLAQDNSGDCRAIYQSDTYLSVFPRRLEFKDDQNTKTHRENKAGGQYYASGSTGTITGKGCDIMVIDDPLKPDDADSDTVRIGVNNNYHNTLYSRLNSKQDGAIVIIMQRIHDDDLCGHLIELEDKGGEKRKKVVIKAIAEETEDYREKGESFFPKRFPVEILDGLKKQDGQTFSSQYQQEPTNKETQEFHEEWFRYHGTQARPTPSYMRIFTAVDPAFKTGQQNDQTSIITAGFIEDRCYILEITAGRITADVMQEKILYHIKKRQPEKIGIEAFQAQSMIVTFLKSEMRKRGIHADIEEITQTGDKLSKIRKLISLYKNGLIYHTLQGSEELEHELKRFPRGKHDDVCLVAGTKIATDKGYKNIEHITMGDKVITPFGYSEVTESKCTGKHQVIKKFGLEGTKTHKIFSYGKGFIKLELLQNIDTLQMLYLINIVKWRILQKLYSSELNTSCSEREDITYLSQKVINEERHQSDCMLPSMRIIMGLVFEKDIVFITKTIILLIMTLVTWNGWRLKNICSTIKNYFGVMKNTLLNVKNTWLRSDHLQRNDTVAKNEENGIDNTERKYLDGTQKNESYNIQLLKSVENAEKNSYHQRSCKSTALQSATAKYHEEREPQETKLVYNITTKAGCYYANDILVSNCDSLQMLYNMYELVPNTGAKKQSFNIDYDYNGNVIYN